MWVCVSQEFGVKEILGKMFKCLSPNEKCHDLELDQLQSKVRQHTETQRYLLVLDDVWEESREAWLKLKDFLVSGKRGCKVVVTSRSKEVARVVGNYPIHELQGLSKEDTWQLFKLVAFDKEEEHVDSNLVKIGKDIVGKCAKVPLSIRVIGSLLYRQDIRKWLSFKENDLAKIQKAKEGEDSTMAVLKFSYYYLTPPLKSCFSYCALFPKDYVIKKDLLIDLWMANGCIVPQYEGQSIEDVGEEYFSILLQRCFFQDISKDYNKNISCKVHDLMHDLALEAAGHESVMLSSMTSHLDKKIRHLSVSKGCSVLNSPYNFSTNIKAVRTFLQISTKLYQSDATKISSNCRCVRWLDLSNASLETLPSGIGRLIHLRCLDLSGNGKLEMLPESITNLHNLQILTLYQCKKLHALPKHLSKLVNLRHLDIDECDALSCIPTGLKNLTCLHRLTMFVVNEDSEEVQMSQLEDLKALVNLRGRLNIKVVKFCSDEMSKVREGAYLSNKPHLKHLDVEFKRDDQGGGDVQEALLEGLQPNNNLISVKVFGYKGVKLASWLLRENTMRAVLSNLVEIALANLPRVGHLPLLSQLCHLKKLFVWDIPNLEHMESEGSYAHSADLPFFPSLEELRLWELPKIKGWWRDGVMVDVEAHGFDSDGIGCSNSGEQRGGNDYGISSLFLFPRLRELELCSCPNMKSLPPCPILKVLRLTSSKGVPLFTEQRAGVGNHNGIDNGLSATASSSLEIGVASIGLSNKSFPGLARLEITTFKDENLWAMKDVFRSCASSLQFLQIAWSHNLKSLRGGGIEHLTSLQKLSIYYEDELELEDEEEPWKSLCNLSSLTLWGLPNLVNLPKGLEYLTALQSLIIGFCHNLTALPEWLSSLTSLRSLNIERCRNMTLLEAKRNLPSHTKLTFEEYSEE